MRCFGCDRSLDQNESGKTHLKCDFCGMVCFKCSGKGDAHTYPIFVNFCPVCGEQIVSTESIDASSFLYNPSDIGCDSKKWTDPKSLGFRKCNNVSMICFESFLIFISDRGQYTIYSSSNLIESASLKIKEKETILRLMFSPRRIVFLTNEKNLYQCSITSLFHNKELEFLSGKVDAFDYDLASDNLAFYSGGFIYVSCFEKPADKTPESGVITKFVIRKGKLFYTKIEKQVMYLVVLSLIEKTQSKLTVTFTDNPDQILTSASNEYLAVLIKKGNNSQLFAGKWRNLIMNSRNWSIIGVNGSVSKILIGNDALVFLQFQDRIEVKDILSLESGARCQRKSISDLYPHSICLSLDCESLSLCCRDTAVTNYEASQMYFISKNLTRLVAASSRAPFVIHSYFWLNGCIVAIINCNGDFQFSVETKV